MALFWRFLIILTIGWTTLSAQESLKWKDLSSNILNPGLDVREWLDDNEFVFQQDKKLLLQNARSGETKILLDPTALEPLNKLGISGLAYESVSCDYLDLIYLHEDDIYYFNIRTKELIRLTDTKSEEKTPTLSPDCKYVAYTRDGNLYLQNLSKPGAEITLSTDGSEEILNGYASWVYYEEILGRRTNYRAFWFSPDSKKLVYLRFDQSKVPIYPVLWFNELYGKLEMQRYPKAGMANPEVSLYLVDIESSKQEKVEIPDTDGNYMAFPRFSPDNSELLYVQWLNRDQNHIKLYVHNTADQTTRIAYEETQIAWVEFFEDGDLFFLPKEQLVVRSSRDGWYHLYLVEKDGKWHQLTQGPWSVNALEAAPKKQKSLFFTAYREDSTRMDLYQLQIGSGRIARLTNEPGSHRCLVSPGGHYYIDTFSSLNKPALTTLIDVKTKRRKILADTSSERFKALEFSQPKLIRMKTGDGCLLPVIYTLPKDYQEGEKLPVILSIYGGPGARGVSDSFSWDFFNNQYLSQKGILVISADHRGAGHHGKLGMNAMHRRLGDVEMADYSSVIDYFIDLGIADPKRIGITGGSYGGYVTALALTRGSDHFKFGIAQCSVTEWKLYDSVYTERYMDTPEQNPEGYKAASVLNYIDKYSGGLLLTHGTVDDNVHMQNTLQLVDKLQDAQKPFQMMLYPRSRHGFRGSKREFGRREEMDFWMRSFFNKPFLMEE